MNKLIAFTVAFTAQIALSSVSYTNYDLNGDL